MFLVHSTHIDLFIWLVRRSGPASGPTTPYNVWVLKQSMVHVLRLLWCRNPHLSYVIIDNNTTHTTNIEPIIYFVTLIAKYVLRTLTVLDQYS